MNTAAVASPTWAIRGKIAEKLASLARRRDVSTTRFAVERTNPGRVRGQRGFAKTGPRRSAPVIKVSSNSTDLAAIEAAHVCAAKGENLLRTGEAAKQAESGQALACGAVAEHGIGSDFIPSCECGTSLRCRWRTVRPRTNRSNRVSAAAHPSCPNSPIGASRDWRRRRDSNPR